MTRYFSAAGDFDQALACGRRALEIGDTLGNVELQVETRFQLGRECYILGEYQSAIALLVKNIETLQGELRSRRFGLPFVASAGTRSWLARCLAERGEFAEGIAHAEEAVEIAEAASDALSLADAHYSLGYLRLLRGEFPKATSELERSLSIVRSSDLRIIFSGTAAALGVAYARCGEFTQALPLLDQVARQSEGERWSQWAASLSEAYLLADRRDQALALTERALKMSDPRQRSFRAAMLQLLGEIASRRDPVDAERADRGYHEALAVATELGMRPLQAHGHLGLGKLCAQGGHHERARAHLSAAADLYRTIDMAFWLPEVESVPAPTR